jgi:hypothetical protein
MKTIELLFKDDLKALVVHSEKTVTSRLTSNAQAHDTFYVDDDMYVVTSVCIKSIKDVDYIAESFNSTDELLQVLNDIYYVNLKRIEHELTVDDSMVVVEFIRVNIIR